MNQRSWAYPEPYHLIFNPRDEGHDSVKVLSWSCLQCFGCQSCKDLHKLIILSEKWALKASKGKLALVSTRIILRALWGRVSCLIVSAWPAPAMLGNFSFESCRPCMRRWICCRLKRPRLPYRSLISLSQTSFCVVSATLLWVEISRLLLISTMPKISFFAFNGTVFYVMLQPCSCQCLFFGNTHAVQNAFCSSSEVSLQVLGRCDCLGGTC